VKISLAMVGFGNVGRAFARLLMEKDAGLREDYGLDIKVTGIATGSHGMAVDPGGFDLNQVLALYEAGGSLSELSSVPQPEGVLDFIRACPADALLENSPLNVETGQPAVDYLRTALECGMHAITANKGPVVHAHRQLTGLADEQGLCFRFESAVMDGAPIFSLWRETLPAAKLRGFHGILNSCTNMILGRMEGGETLEEAVAYAQSIGITETDPSADIDGWDASVKVTALASVLMGAELKPQQVERTGIRCITPERIAEAKQAGERWKLVCSAAYEGDKLVARVRPQRVAAGSPMYGIEGTSSFVQFESDVLPALGVIEGDPGPETTAYGLLADLLNIYKKAR
jgi:homoserine dehydrogenase